MKHLPKTENALLLRTDFAHQTAWDALCMAAQEPSEEGFTAFVDCVSDPAYDGLTVEQLVAVALQSGDRSFALLADSNTLSNPEMPVLVVDLYTAPGRTFRVVPRELWAVENNLSLANMDFDDFATNVDGDGVFRGFPRP